MFTRSRLKTGLRVGWTAAAACLPLFCLLTSALVAADPPAGPGAPAPPCVLEDLEKAKTALKEATDKLAELDKDPRKPAPSQKFTKDYENDKASADADVKLTTTAVTNAEKDLEKVKKWLEAKETEKGAKYGGKNGTQIADERDQLYKQTKTNGEQLAKAMIARTALSRDPKIVEQSRLMGPEEAILRKEMSRYMDPAKSDPVLDKLRDPASRAQAKKQIDDDSYTHIEFTAFTPDGDVIGHAEQLIDQYITFSDRQLSAVRQQLQAAVKDARDRKPGAQDEMRRLGPMLIEEINRCRIPVRTAFTKVAGRLDAIDRRMKELDPDGVDLIEKIPELQEESKKLEARKAALDTQFELALAAKEVTSAEKTLAVQRQALEDAKKTAKAADLALTNYKGYDTLIDPWIKKQKTAQSDVDRLQKAADAEAKAKDTALAKAQADYAANEKDLADFRAKALKEKADIDKLRGTDAKAANTQLKALADKVKEKKAAAAKIVEGIKAALDPYRRCFKDANEYVENVVKPKILALGGTAGAGLAVSDMEDPWAALLDVPVDKTTPTVAQPEKEEWIRSKPVFASNNTEGLMPKGLQGVSATSLSYTTERDGKTWTNTLTWSEPPAVLHKGDVVTLKMDASTQQGWGNVGGWFNIKCVERDSFSGDNGAGSDKNWRAKSPNSGTCTFKFDPNAGNPPYIQVSAGHDPNPVEWMLVTWKYEKKAK